MTDTPSRTGIVHLTERQPTVSGAPRCSRAWSRRRSSMARPSRATARMPRTPRRRRPRRRSSASPGRGAPVKRGGFFSRAKKEPDAKPGVYLDGGFGVGKTHLLASIYHAMPARRKYFGSFIEYTALVGALGYKNTVDLLKGADLLCIDEFELDDPGDTMVMTRLLGELVPTGTKLAATSNTPAERAGRGTLRRAGLPPRDPRDVRQLPDDPHRRRRLPSACARRSRGRARRRRVRRQPSRRARRARHGIRRRLRRCRSATSRGCTPRGTSG